MLIIILCISFSILLVAWVLAKIPGLWYNHNYELQDKMIRRGAAFYRCTKSSKAKIKE